MGETNDAIKSVAALAQKAVAAPIVSEPTHFMVIPNDHKIESLHNYQHSDRPLRKKTAVTLFDVASFVQYFNNFHDENSQIFADPDKLSFTAYLDYHEMGDGQPRFLEHRASMTCKTSREWNIWYGSNNKQMEQTEFALFLEDNVPCVIKPSAGALLDVARFLKAKKDVEFSSDVNLSNGQVQFKYHETIQGQIRGGEESVPESFTLKIPVFWNGPQHEIVARLRWRINAEKKLIFWYTLVQAKKILEDGFNETVKAVEKDTKAVVMLGVVG